MRFSEADDVPAAGPSDGLLKPVDDHSFTVVFGDGHDVGPVTLRAPGLDPGWPRGADRGGDGFAVIGGLHGRTQPVAETSRRDERHSPVCSARFSLMGSRLSKWRRGWSS